jgi:pilus assembly protein CpaC
MVLSPVSVSLFRFLILGLLLKWKRCGSFFLSFLLGFVIFLVGSFPLHEAQALPSIFYEYLGLGETKILSGFKSPVLIPKQNIFDVSVQGSVVKLQAKKPGFILIKDRHQVYEVSALSLRQIRTYTALKTKFHVLQSISVTVKRGEVWLEGELPYMRVLKQIQDLCASLPCEFHNALRVPRNFQSKVRDFLYFYMQERGFSGGQILFDPYWKVLWPRQPMKKDQGVDLLKVLGLESEYHPQAVKIEPGVRAHLLIAEVRKQQLHQFGVQFPPQLTAQVLPENKIFEPAFLTLNWAEQAGVGKTLATPSLLVKSGGQAEFVAGGEIPIRLVGERSNHLQWKKYGILIKLSVKTDFSGRMSLGLECEVSSIDGSISVEGIPGFKTNRVSTQFDLMKPRPLVLSGLLKSDQSRAVSGLRGLTQLPILGSLFSSQDFRDDQSELLIIIKPELVLPQD